MTTKKQHISREWHVLYPGSPGEAYSSLAQALEHASKEGARARLVKVEANGLESAQMRVLDPEKAPYTTVVRDGRGNNKLIFHTQISAFVLGFPAFDAQDHEEAAIWLKAVIHRSENSFGKWRKLQIARYARGQDLYTADGSRVLNTVPELPAEIRKKMRTFWMTRQMHYEAIERHGRAATWLRRNQEGRSVLFFHPMGK